MDFAHMFSKNYSLLFFFFFLIKFIHFTLKIYSFGPKIASKAFCTTKDAKSFVKINFLIKFFTFLSVTRQNFEYNLRILVNFGKFSRKNSKIYGFRPYVFKKIEKFSRKNLKIYGFRQYVLKKTYFFFVFFKKDYTFYTKNLFICPKNCVQRIFYNETCKEFRKNQFFRNIFTFLSVIRQKF